MLPFYPELGLVLTVIKIILPKKKCIEIKVRKIYVPGLLVVILTRPTRSGL